MKEKYTTNKCICCEDEFKAYYGIEVEQFLAEACDVCPECFALGCPGISSKQGKCEKSGQIRRDIT